MRRLAIAVILVAACARPAAPSSTAAAVPSASSSPAPHVAVPGRIELGSFHSAALNRTMPFTVYLPPGYDANRTARYPTAYMLHGGCGCMSEWIDYGLLKAADRLMGDATIAPFIIVLPQGDQEYWVDHVLDPRTGANGEKWGTYVARDVVPEIDRRYRTVAAVKSRSIGGMSMGGHAAMQLSLNFPGIWSVIGAHSPAARPLGDAPSYLGRTLADFNARDPLALIKAKPDLARTYVWWIDSGDVDPWRAGAAAVHDELARQKIPHEWHPYPGDHSATYWGAHVDDYLRYYAGALCKAETACPKAP